MKIKTFVDDILNKTPMYKLVIYVLLAFTAFSFLESFTGLIEFNLQSLAISLVSILVICVGLNFICAKVLKLPFQYDSSIITGLILFLILVPGESNMMIYSILIASVVATLSKYILVWRNTHIFNPAAIGIYATTLLGFGSAFWWVGNTWMLPLVLMGGFLIIRKTRREVLFTSALISYIVGILLTCYFFNMNFPGMLWAAIISGPTIFFITIMMTEPHTIAKNRNQQIIYGFLIPILPVVSDIFNFVRITPELSLLIGNLVSFVISNRKRFILKLENVVKLNDTISEFHFSNRETGNFKFKPGEFLEWNLPHESPDSRSTRRYFTISSASNEHKIAFATKFSDTNPSSFKNKLKELKAGEVIYATQLGGDFLLPNSSKTPIAQIAGGIGITPFISQIRTELKNPTGRNITLFYCVNTFADIAYMDLLKEAARNEKSNIRVVFVIGSPAGVIDENHKNMFFESGYLTSQIVTKYIQKLSETKYYISGPNKMVEMMEIMLHTLKVKNKSIYTDYFPGF